MNYLQEKASICDVIAWTMAAPAIAIGCIFCPYLIQIFPKFNNMFSALNAKLPAITVFVLANNWWFCSILPIIISIGIVIGLWKSYNKSISILISGVGLVLNWVIFGTAVSANFYQSLKLKNNCHKELI